MGDVYTNPPQSRNEAILNSIVEGTQYTDPPQSRIEDLLLEVKQVIEEGGHDESATRASIAPTESDSAHASKNIVVDEQFYLSDDKLYTATSAISQGDAIVVYPTSGYNCRVSDSVTEQIASLDAQKADNSVIAPVENGTTASKAYAVGSHFIRGGKFCTCKANTAQGETCTLNTNYVEGALGDVVHIKVETSTQSVPANSKAWFYMDSLIPFANYEVLNVSFMISGAGSGNYAIGSWIYTTDYNVAISVHNLDTADAHSWKVTAYLTLKI